MTLYLGKQQSDYQNQVKENKDFPLLSETPGTLQHFMCN